METDGESAAAIRSDRGGGTLTSKNGGVFYTTNTESDITLKDVDITYNNDNEYFLRCTGNNKMKEDGGKAEPTEQTVTLPRSARTWKAA